MYRLSFLSSGTGSLTKTVLLAIEKGVLNNITPVSIISDRDSESLKLTSTYNIATHIVDFNTASLREQSSDKILAIFKKEKIDFSFTTFDRILKGKIISEYKNRLINLHPSLLPSFPGYDTIQKASEYGSKFIGATCHFIDEEIDHGPIINQAVLPLDINKKLAEAEEQLYHLRQRLALEALYAYSNKLIRVRMRNVSITNAKYNGYPLNPSLNIPIINSFLKKYA